MEASIDMREPAPTLEQLIGDATAMLSAAGIDTARLDAEVLLATACGITRGALYARLRQPAQWCLQLAFRAMLIRRVAREPLQYIVGHQEFWSLDFLVTPDVLIPRPETELLVELTLDLPLREPNDGSFGSALPLTLCDLGTGSGCIAIALARELPSSEVWALDMSPVALAIAQANARRHGVMERVHFLDSDLFASVAGRRFDVILSNPPYLRADDAERCQPELLWEPWQALHGGDAGLDIIERVLAAAPDHLVDGGWLLLEIGADQESAVTALAHTARFRRIAAKRDHAGLPRVLLAQV